MEEQQHALNDIDLMRLPLLSNISLDLLDTIRQKVTVCFFRDGETIFHLSTRLSSFPLRSSGSLHEHAPSSLL